MKDGNKRTMMADVVAIFALMLLWACAAQVEPQPHTLVQAKQQTSAQVESKSDDDAWTDVEPDGAPKPSYRMKADEARREAERRARMQAAREAEHIAAVYQEAVEQTVAAVDRMSTFVEEVPLKVCKNSENQPKKKNRWESDASYRLVMPIPYGEVDGSACYDIVVRYPKSVRKGAKSRISVEVRFADGPVFHGTYAFKAAENLAIIHGDALSSNKLFVSEDKITVGFYTGPTISDYDKRKAKFNCSSQGGLYTVTYEGFGDVEEEWCKKPKKSNSSGSQQRLEVPEPGPEPEGLPRPQNPPFDENRYQSQEDPNAHSGSSESMLESSSAVANEMVR